MIDCLSKNNRPYTTAEFFAMIVNGLKQQGKIPKGCTMHLDYEQAPSILEDDCYVEFRLKPCFPNVLVTFYLVGGVEDQELEGTFLGNIYSPPHCNDRDFMVAMAKLAANITYEANNYIESNELEFLWKGFVGIPDDEDGFESYFEDYNYSALISKVRKYRGYNHKESSPVFIFSCETRKCVKKI